MGASVVTLADIKLKESSVQRNKLLKIFVSGLCLFMGLVMLFNLTLAHAQERKADRPALAPPPPAPKTPENLLKEATSIRNQHPEGAIQLLLMALALRPDFLPARRQLAAIYEGQNKLDMAIGEHEAITRATGSPESHADLVAAMEKAGFFVMAAETASRAYARHPNNPLMLLKAGELFLKAGDDNNAANSLQEFIKRDPRQGKAFLLLGEIQERAGRFPEALRAYLKAGELLKDSREATEALQRLRARAREVEKLWLFLPDGWTPEKNGMSNISQNQRISITVSAKGNPEALALQAARELMPRGLFTDELLKSYDSMKKMKAEMAASGMAAKDLPDLPLPFFSKKSIAGPPAAHMVTLATSERPQIGLESASVAAVSYEGRIYLFAWRGYAPYNQGEETLAAMLKQVLWPR